MTLDCSPEFADALEARLDTAADIAHYGTFRQDSALLTCFVPSVSDRSHVHFVDGAGGGYAMAAQALKATARGRGRRNEMLRRGRKRTTGLSSDRKEW